MDLLDYLIMQNRIVLVTVLFAASYLLPVQFLSIISFLHTLVLMCICSYTDYCFIGQPIVNSVQARKGETVSVENASVTYNKSC